MQKLVIVDGNAILHRAFHALPPLTDKDGNLTHAIYGFVSMLLKIDSDLVPSHLLVCFDRPEPTFRKTMYVGYQAKRPKMDEGLSSQIERVKKVVTSMKIPIYELAGFEADDVIGTLASQATKKQFDEVVIITGDRDILQLVNDTVHVYMPIQGLTNAKMFSEKEVEEKYGIKPLQIIDYKALAGDSSDNYPGVRGIGPKTASELLKRYDSIEGIYKAIKNKDNGVELLKEKTIQALSEYAEDCAMAKKLATIVTDVPVVIDVEKTRLHDLNTKEAIQKLEDLGFKSLIKRLGNHKNMKALKHEIKNPEKKEENKQMSLL